MLAAPLPQARSGSQAAGRPPSSGPWVVWLLVLAGLVGVASWSDLLAVSRDLRLPDNRRRHAARGGARPPRRQPWFDPRPAPPCRRAADALVALRRCADRRPDPPGAQPSPPARPGGGDRRGPVAAAAARPLRRDPLPGRAGRLRLARREPSRSLPAPRPSSSPACSPRGGSTTTTSRSARSSPSSCCSPGRPRPDGTGARRLARGILAGGRARGAAVHRRGRPRPRRVSGCSDGRAALPPFRGFGLALGLAAPLLFLAQTAPSLWTATACDALSRRPGSGSGPPPPSRPPRRPWCRTNAGGACGSGCSPPAAPSRSGASSFCSRPVPPGRSPACPTSCGRNGS